MNHCANWKRCVSVITLTVSHFPITISTLTLGKEDTSFKLRCTQSQCIANLYNIPFFQWLWSPDPTALNYVLLIRSLSYSKKRRNSCLLCNHHVFQYSMAVIMFMKSFYRVILHTMTFWAAILSSNSSRGPFQYFLWTCILWTCSIVLYIDS